MRCGRIFHQHPEPSFQEHLTQAKILEFLTGEGIECVPCAGTGVIGLIRGARPGPTIALRADIDAASGVQDEKAAPYRSQNDGVTHCCGHDGHAAIQMGGARILHKCRDGFHGNVKLLFDPGEEGHGGALA